MNATETLPASVLTKKQVRTYGWESFNDRGVSCRIRVKVRYDDQCGNGHNTFSITGEIQEARDGVWKDSSFGQLHADIAKHFPQLAPLLKWHLCSSDGPMHYLANTVYHASDGGRGQQRVDRYGNPMWQLERVPYEAGLVCQTEKPADVVLTYKPVIEEGKEIELDHARSSAIWPEATDEQLLVGDVAPAAALLARLPALMVEFKAAVESLGMVY